MELETLRTMRTLTHVGSIAFLTGCNAVIFLEDDNNYDYTGQIDMPRIQTVAGQDLTVDWVGLSADLRCHDLVPADVINNLGLIRFPNLSEEEIEDRLSTDSLLQSDTSGALELSPNGATQANLSDFSFGGESIEIATEYTDDGGLYLLTFSAGGALGVDTRMLALLDPEPASSNAIALVSDACGILDFSSRLSALRPVSMPASGDSWIVDWGRLTQTGLDKELIFSNIDGLSLAFYADATLDALETQFLDLELIATRTYTMAVTSGVGAELTEAKTESGESFSGFLGEGVWLLGLTCSTCANPAPLFLTIVEPS